MKYLMSLVAGVAMLGQVCFANNYAYLYIEGDKQTPFYVKLEGQMQPRLGKNYCIISNLAAGVTNIEILFQQNTFPAQKFALNIPEGGSRGFVLQKVNDRQFALYDLQQGHYVVSGNKPEDDQAAAASPAAIPAEAASTPVAAAGSDEALPAFGTTKKRKQKPAKETLAEAPKEDSRFIGDMELNAGAREEPLPDFDTRNKQSSKNKKKKVNTREAEGALAAISDEEEDNTRSVSKAPVPEPVETGMPNTDCKTAMTSDDFESFALKILDKTDDDARLKVLSKNKGRQCFTTEQVRIIANNFDTQSGRYEVARMLYAQTSDQGNYTQLESLFKTNYLKGKFREIINPK